MKASILLSIAALSASAVAVPAADTTTAASAIDPAVLPLLKLDHFLGYYCSIPGKCKTSTAPVAAEASSSESDDSALEKRSRYVLPNIINPYHVVWHWQQNYCQLPGMACPDKRDLKPEAANAIERRSRYVLPNIINPYHVVWHWQQNYCQLPGMACPDKRSLTEGGKFPGAEALAEDASEEQKSDAERFKIIAELLFGDASE